MYHSYGGWSPYGTPLKANYADVEGKSGPWSKKPLAMTKNSNSCGCKSCSTNSAGGSSQTKGCGTDSCSCDICADSQKMKAAPENVYVKKRRRKPPRSKPKNDNFQFGTNGNPSSANGSSCCGQKEPSPPMNPIAFNPPISQSPIPFWVPPLASSATPPPFFASETVTTPTYAQIATEEELPLEPSQNPEDTIPLSNSQIPSQVPLSLQGGTLIPSQVPLPEGGGAFIPSQVQLPSGDGGIQIPSQVQLLSPGGSVQIPSQISLPEGDGTQVSSQIPLPSNGGTLIPSQIQLPSE